MNYFTRVMERERERERENSNSKTLFFFSQTDRQIIIMYIYHALINALGAPIRQRHRQTQRTARVRNTAQAKMTPSAPDADSDQDHSRIFLSGFLITMWLTEQS